MNSMLELRNVSKSYRNQQILTDISLEIREREMVSIMGKSGAGKSTLLAVMAGLVRPDSGQVFFGGSNISDLDEEKLAAFRLQHIGFIFQDFKLLPSLTVHDNIMLGIYPRRDIPSAEKEKRIRDFAGHVGLTVKLAEKVDNLSGGEKQRVAIARSLVNRPGLVLADEPTGNLDSSTAQDIMALFRKLHETLDTTFLIITHDLDIASFTQKTFTLKDGGLTP
ncbi:MAG: ABC transporter ATP-binding protein [Deltaproteobacteria bacterium]|nr:ABC transporter ATP-binding protein [Deltaproteobacteria bacterium]